MSAGPPDLIQRNFLGPDFEKGLARLKATAETSS
jgi:hypothetical protein